LNRRVTRGSDPSIEEARLRRFWTGRPLVVRLAALVWIAVLLWAAIGAGRRAWVSDDIYITFRYCDNALAGHGPVYNPGERSEGYTHFLWFVLLWIGRMCGIEAHLLGKYAGLPFYVLSLVWLVRLSSRLFPGRGGPWGLPVAMLGWALLEDARLFAGGGLETHAFICCLLVGFEFTCVSAHRRRAAWAAWALAMACLLRPEGLVYTALAMLWFVFQRRRDPGAWRIFAAVWLALVAPLFVFRMLYYGWPLPNPYYAKSGGGSNWPQGVIYARLFFQSYMVLLVPLFAAIPIGRALRKRRAPAAWGTSTPALAAAWVTCIVILFAVIRGGGDFMFARFFLPITPFLLLLLEALVQLAPRLPLRVGATLLVAALVVFGATRKKHWLGRKHNVNGIVDEPQFYPNTRTDNVRELSQALRDCLAGTNAVLMVQGGQASLAYYARYPVAVERFGLTDETIAHSPVVMRGRPGHEKYASPEYIYARRINLRVNYRPMTAAPQYTLFALPGVSGEIIVYDRALMEHMKTCSGAAFLDFPLWLAETYLPGVPTLPETRLRRDWNEFLLYYFDTNADPEGLRERLRAALAARGVTGLPEHGKPVDPFTDLGR
jgi:arabinofuranosyltransferase